MHVRPALVALLLSATAAVPVVAQQSSVQRDLRASQLKLDSIMAERDRLQREMTTLRDRVRDASRELVNIERQMQASRSAMLELEFQTQLLTDNVETATRDHAATKAKLDKSTEELHERLRMIYKRGRLHSVQVMLAARSFSDLLNRHKYLSMMAAYDRMVVQDYTRLERQLARQQRELRESLARLDALREDKAMEVAELERIERERQRTLREFRQQESRTASRLEELEREQTRVAGTIEELERRRIAEERLRTSVRPGTISPRDLGQLPWPVEGDLLYYFGPDRKGDGIVLKHQGIGIGATAGTPVRAVVSGIVEFAGTFPGYGPTVIVSHGGGYRTLYLYLQGISVEVNQQVRAGEEVGTVGGERTAEGPHIEFQVRVPMDSGIEPVDPLTWLRPRRSP